MAHATVHMEKSRDNFGELVLSFHLEIQVLNSGHQTYAAGTLMY